jgi:hypothetical protein
MATAAGTMSVSTALAYLPSSGPVRWSLEITAKSKVKTKHGKRR